MGEIFKLIPRIMDEVGAIGKNKENKQQGYAYRGVDDAYAALQSLFAKYGVFTAPTVLKDETEERTTKHGSHLIYRRLTVKYTFYAHDGSSFETIVLGEGMDSGDKASNKAMSVAHKYALLQAFLIPTDEPKDPEVDHHEVVPKQTHYEPIEGVKQTPPTSQPQPLTNQPARKPPAPAKEYQNTTGWQPKFKKPSEPKASELLNEGAKKFWWVLIKQMGWDKNEAADLMEFMFGHRSLDQLTKGQMWDFEYAIRTRPREIILAEMNFGSPEPSVPYSDAPPLTDDDIPF